MGATLREAEGAAQSSPRVGGPAHTAYRGKPVIAPAAALCRGTWHSGGVRTFACAGVREHLLGNDFRTGSVHRTEEEITMTVDRLVCANCSGPVSEGRCEVCRANRARLQQENPWSAITPAALIALLVALLAVVLVVEHATA